MATQAQKDEILFITKQIVSMKVKRNRYKAGSKSKKAIQAVIDLAEKDLTQRRNKYGLPLK